MSDALVRELNRLGYQPVFLPRAGVKPPELYNYEQKNRRLVRRGALSEYLPAAKELIPTSDRLADIAYKYTSAKEVNAAVGFLANALRCIGIESVPKIDLGFAGSKNFSFAFTQISYLSVNPARLDQVLRGMSISGIPREYVEAGRLHIAYEYAYTHELIMSRADKKAFSQEISGAVGTYFDLGTKGSVSVINDSTISFRSESSAAAFAYKAGRLEQEDGGWVLFPEEVSRSGYEDGNGPPYLPQRGVVLSAQD